MQYSDSGSDYMKYTSHPANKHDDSKLQEKFGSNLQGSTPEKVMNKPDPYKPDPYRHSRGNVNPYKTATIDKSKLSDLSSKYPWV